MDDWPENTLEARRKMVRATLRTATLEELKALGAQRFIVPGDPWCEHYNTFLNQHPNSKFYRADTPEGAEVVYCRDAEQGIWFLPEGNGMGYIQPRGLMFLKDLVDSM